MNKKIPMYKRITAFVLAVLLIISMFSELGFGLWSKKKDVVKAVEEIEGPQEEQEEYSFDEKMDYDAMDIPAPFIARAASMNEDPEEEAEAEEDKDYFAFSLRYIDEGFNYYDVQKDDDFSLKYELVFLVKKDIKKGEARIYLDAELFTLRDGTPVIPSQFGIPSCEVDDEGNITKYFETVNSSFNYYYTKDENGKNIVVLVNYQDFKSGDRERIEVLYNKLSSFDIVDDTNWTLHATATVGNHETEYQTMSTGDVGGIKPLTGKVDTRAELTSLTKKAFRDNSVAYTPGLYSKTQVESFLGTSLSGEYLKDDGSLDKEKYIFFVWQIESVGNCNQTWDLYFNEFPYDGKIVGVSTKVDNRYIPAKYISKADAEYPGGYVDENGEQPKLYFVASTNNHTEYGLNKRKNFTVTSYVVTAHDASKLAELEPGEKLELKNDVKAVLRPADGKDDIEKDGSAYEIAKPAEGGYEDYTWAYRDDISTLTKASSGYKLNAWLDAFNSATVNNNENHYGSFEYTLKSYTRGYEATHKLWHNDEYEAYTGGYVELITADDAIYIRDDSKVGSTSTKGIVTRTFGGTDSTKLTKDDYYYTKVKITLSENAYDVWEDKKAKPGKLLDDVTGQDLKWTVYMKFANGPEADTWVNVKELSWDSFIDLINKCELDIPTSFNGNSEPYTVKVVHNLVNYDATVAINLTATIRDDSPVFKALYNEYTRADVVDGPAYNIEKGDIYSVIVDNVGSYSAKEVNTAYLYKYTVDGKTYYYEKEDASTTGLPNGAELVSAPGTYVTSKELGKPSSNGIGAGGTTYADSIYDGLSAILTEIHGNSAGGIMVADAAYLILPMERHAKAFKKASAVNNPNYGRVDLTYTLAAFEGYRVYSEGAKKYLVNDIDRKVVEFYDLLPENVQYDGSVSPVVARVNRVDANRIVDSIQFWDEAEVSLINTEVVPNYNDTGRTLVKFTLEYTGADCTKYDGYEAMWYAGYAIKFNSYVSWIDYEASKSKYNICAYMPAVKEGDTYADNILGTGAEVALDNGTPNSNLASEWLKKYEFVDSNGVTRPLLGKYEEIDGEMVTGDINNDGKYDARNVLYASDVAITTIATASRSGIVKKVHADDDTKPDYRDDADVGFGKGYSYEVTLTNSNSEGEALKNIVIFDRLENSYTDKGELDISALAEKNKHITVTTDGDQTSYDWTEDVWTGTFNGVDVTSLVGSRGILVTVYTNTNRNVNIPKISTFDNSDTDHISFYDDDEKPATYSFSENGWVPYITYKIVGKNIVKEVNPDVVAADVKAIAMDLHRTYVPDGDGYKEVPFVLENNDSLRFNISMTAPLSALESQVYAYNNVYYYSTVVKTGADVSIDSTLPGNITTAKLGDTETLVIKKSIDENQLDSLSQSTVDNSEFVFEIRDSEGKSCSNKKYTLWTYVGTDYVNNSTGWKWNAEHTYMSNSATHEKVDAEGYLLLNGGEYQTITSDSTITLAKDQKAIIEDVRYASKYQVIEKIDLNWKARDVLSEDTDNFGNKVYEHDITNTFQPVVYVQKLVYPKEAANDDLFGFQIIDESNTPVANADFYFVKSTVGMQLDTDENGENRKGHSDENGIFYIKANEIAALMLPEQLGEKITIKELESNDWLCEVKNNGYTFKVTENSQIKKFTNDYRYKELEVTKKLDHANLIKNRSGLSGVHFNFNIYRVLVNPETGEELVKADGSKDKMPYDALPSISITFTGSEVLASDGSVKAVKVIDMLPAYEMIDGKAWQYVYYVEETAPSFDEGCEFSEEDFLFSHPEEFIKFNYRADGSAVELINDYAWRGLEVTKRVIANPIPSDGEAEFVLYLMDAKENPIEASFTTSKGRTGKTDKETGEFTIHADETVRFEKLGTVGTVFRISEKIDDRYMPLSLTAVDGLDRTLSDKFTIGSDGKDSYEYTVTNGSEEYLVLNKQYLAAGTDAENYLASHILPDVTLKLEIERAGEWIEVGTYEITSGENAIVHITEEIKKIYGDDLPAYDSENPSVVSQYNAIRFRVSEIVIPELADENGISYKILRESGDVLGNVAVDKRAAITNKLISLVHRSTVYKYEYYSTPDANAKLVWQVQKYNTETKLWEVASDVNYRIYSGDGKPQSDISTTNQTGKIEINYKSRGDIYFAYVVFDRIVKANIGPLTDDNKSLDGNWYRVVEVPAESDASWGSLIGYGSSQNFDESKIFTSKKDTFYDNANVKDADIFINSAETEEIIVSKKVVGEIDSNDIFTFDLIQVLEGEENKAINIEYSVFEKGDDEEDDKRIDIRRTDDKGRFTLENGQYAVINVPKYNTFKVVEEDIPNWQLQKIEILEGDDDVSLLPDGTTAEDAQGAIFDASQLDSAIEIIFNVSEENGSFTYNNGIEKQTNRILIKAGIDASKIKSDAELESYALNGKYRIPDVLNEVTLFTGWRNGDDSVGSSEAEILKYVYKYVSTHPGTDVINLDAVIVGNNAGIYDFPYKNDNKPYTFIAPETGYYFMEGWGAQGGADGLKDNKTLSEEEKALHEGGKGAYTSGYLYLNKGEMIYVYVGGKGEDGGKGNTSVANGGFNGGGDGAIGYGNGTGATDFNGGAGGGATDFRLASGEWNNYDSLASRIMVAGAGSGARSWSGGSANRKNYAGTLEGQGERNTKSNAASGGTQTSGGAYAGTDKTGHSGKGDGRGTNGGFGFGGDACYYHGSGAGSGYYGGGGGGWENSYVMSGAGGSSFISGYEGCDAISAESTEANIVHTGQANHYSGKVFVNPVMLAGNEAMKAPNGDAETGHSGNGFARITYHETFDFAANTLDESENDNGSTGEIQEFVAPKSGYYMLEAWGAQGASKYLDGQPTGGKGAYTSGIVYLAKGQTIYLTVGRQPTTKSSDLVSGETNPGGFNGGGYVQYATEQNSGSGGGGATDFRLVAPDNLKDWDDFNSLKSRVMVAAGGGGGDKAAYGGGGGTLEGTLAGYSSTNYPGWYATGGTQTGGGVPGNALNTSTGVLTLVNGSSNKGYFGKGGNAIQSNYGGNGGGGGYYGGGASVRPHGGGGGGSSYVSGYEGCNAIDGSSTATNIKHTNQPNHYSGMVFDNPTMKAEVNEGDGKARITYIDNDLPEGAPLSINSAINSISFYEVTDRTIDETTFNYALDTSDLIDANNNGRYLAGGEAIGKSKVLDYTSDKYADLLYGKVEIPEYVVTCKDGEYQKNKIIAIGQQAYEHWDNKMTSVIMPDSIEALGFRAFTNVELNKSDDNIVYVSKGLKYAGAFSVCFHIQTGYNNDSVLIMNCSKEDGLYFQNTQMIFGNEDRAQFFNTIVIGEGFTTIETDPLVKTKGNHVFPTQWVQLNNVSKPKQIIYNNDIISISERAFMGGKGLTTFLPYSYDDVQYEYDDGKVVNEEITTYKFYDEQTREVNIPDEFVGSCVLSGSIKDVGNMAFHNTGFTKDLVVDCSVTHLGGVAFYNVNFTGALRLSHGLELCNDWNNKIAYSGNVATIQAGFGQLAGNTGGGGFFGNSDNNIAIKFTSIDFDFRNIDTDTMHTICEHCGKEIHRMNLDRADIFRNWSSLKDVRFGSAVKNISTALNSSGGPMFPGSLRTVVFSEGVEIIGDRVFQDLNDLGNITGDRKNPNNMILSFPSTLTTVGRCAFRSCYGLAGLEIRGAENGTSKLREMYPFSIQLCTNMIGTLVIPASMEIMSVKCLHSSMFDTIVFMGSGGTYDISTKIYSTASSTESHDHIFDYEGVAYPVKKIYVNENATQLLTGLKANKVTGPANQKWFYMVNDVASLIETYKTGETPWQ